MCVCVCACVRACVCVCFCGGLFIYLCMRACMLSSVRAGGRACITIDWCDLVIFYGMRFETVTWEYPIFLWKTFMCRKL